MVQLTIEEEAELKQLQQELGAGVGLTPSEELELEALGRELGDANVVNTDEIIPTEPISPIKNKDIIGADVPEISVGLSDTISQTIKDDKQAVIDKAAIESGEPEDKINQWYETLSFGMEPLAKADTYLARYHEIKIENIANKAQEILGGDPVDVIEGLPGITTRFDIAYTDKLEDKEAKLKAAFPLFDTKILDIEDERYLMFRQPDRTTWQFADEPAITSSDVVDFSANVIRPSVLAEVGINILLRGQGGVLSRVLLDSIGGAGGTVVEQKIEEARGFDTRTEDIKNQEVVLGAAFPVIARGLTHAAMGTVNFVRGAYGSLTPEAQLVADIAKQEGLEDLTLGQVKEIAARQELQLANLTGVIERVKQKQRVTLLNKFTEQFERISDYSAMSTERLTSLVSGMRNSLLQKTSLKNLQTTLEEGGTALQTGIQEYRDAALVNIDKLYKNALNTADEDIGFITTSIKTVSDDILKQTKATLPKGITDDDLAAFEIIRQMGTEADVTFFQKEFLEKTGVDFKLSVDSKLVNIANTFQEVSNEVKGDIFDRTAYEQLKLIRTELYDLKQVAPGNLATNSNRLASNLYNAVTESLQNPTGGGDEFVSAWTLANDYFKEHIGVMERPIIKTIRNTQDTVPSLVGQFVENTDVTKLRLIKDVLPKDKFETFKKAYQTDLLIDPNNIISKLDKFRNNQESLRLLMDKKTEETFRNLSIKNIQLTNHPVIGKLLKNSDESLNNAKKFLSTGTIPEFKQVLDVGGEDFRRTLRAGVLSDIIDSSSRLSKGGLTEADPRILTNKIDEYKKNGLLDLLFEKKDAKSLKNIQIYSNFIRSTKDSGASLQAAEKIAAAFNLGTAFTRPADWFGAVLAVKTARLQATIWTNPTFSKIIMGTEKSARIPQKKINTIGGYSAFMGAVVAKMFDISDETDKGMEAINEAFPGLLGEEK
jgi:hypothetical protein